MTSANNINSCHIKFSIPKQLTAFRDNSDLAFLNIAKGLKHGFSAKY